MSNEVEYKFPAAPQDCATILPNEARSIFSRGEYYGTSAGFCLGYLQANLVVLPQEHADNFEEFCNKNSAAFPLLFRSRPGEVEAPPLAKDFNVRSVEGENMGWVTYEHIARPSHCGGGRNMRCNDLFKCLSTAIARFMFVMVSC